MSEVPSLAVVLAADLAAAGHTGQLSHAELDGIARNCEATINVAARGDTRRARAMARRIADSAGKCGGVILGRLRAEAAFVSARLTIPPC